ncbi:MAG TPA: GldM family protein [Chitinophagales bacterium]|nr:GldM family protein [Chitinophagales bacterium]
MRGTNPLRQKLINFLYLVLIGMIVLNLPVEFIEAFTDLNRTLEYANYKLDQKNYIALKQVERFSSLDSARFAKIYMNIKAVKALSDSTFQYLEKIKLDLIAKGGGWGPYKHLRNAIDASVPTKRMIYGGVAKETRDVLLTTKTELLKFLDSSEQKILDSVLITDNYVMKADGRKYSWEKYYFDNVPLGAVIALLTKFQNDVLLAESIVINKFYQQAESGVSFVLAENFSMERELNMDTILLERADNEMDVFNLGEEATIRVTVPRLQQQEELIKQAVIYTYDEEGVILDSFLFKEGVGEINLPTNQIGEFKIKGVVKYRYPDEGIGEEEAEKDEPEQVLESKMQEHTFELDYTVVNPKPYISHRDYDVLYAGVNNPINVFHPEFSPENYNVSITQGKIIYDGKQFFAKVYRPGYVTITLSVPDQAGGFKKVAEQQFKVEELPKPRAKLYNSYGGQMPVSIFKKQRELNADVEGLEIDAKFRVMEYTVTYINKSGLGIFKEKVNGSYFTDKSLELINLAEPGDIYLFEDIKIKGPDGKNIDVNPVAFTII